MFVFNEPKMVINSPLIYGWIVFFELMHCVNIFDNLLRKLLISASVHPKATPAVKYGVGCELI